MALHASSLLLSICLIATVLALPSPAIHSLTVNVSPFAELAASGPLRHSLNHLYDFIFNFEKDVSVSGECSEAFPPALFIDLIVTWKEHHLTPAAEGYTVATNTSSGDVSILANGLLGVAYAIHDFTQHLGLQLSRSPAASCVAYTAHWREVSAAFHAVPVSPVALRTWTEEGQLLALPDPGYYTASGLAANITALLSEAQALEGEIVPNILRLHFNSITVLNSDVEDYVNYDLLPRFMKDAPVIYSPSDPHRTRTAGIVSVLAPWIQHLADDFGISLYFQVYELSSPPGVCSPVNATSPPALLNCSLSGPHLYPLLQARYSELAEKLPSLAGIILTVEDSWSPRAGYLFNVVWSKEEELHETVTTFYDAITGTAGLDMTFRLWIFGAPVNWTMLRDGSPAGAKFSVKQTQGDFLLDFPQNTLLECNETLCPARDRGLWVEVDVFRQYNGWTSGVCWMGPQWGPRISHAVSIGTSGIEAWGSWAPGCTWPSNGYELVNGTAGQLKSWRQWWNSYRLFNGTATNGGFSFGGQANAYLIYRLTVDPPPVNTTQIALDFGTLFYGAANAEAVLGILEASFGAWLSTSTPSNIGDFSLFWSMMQRNPFNPEGVDEFDRLVSKNHVTVAASVAGSLASAGNVSVMLSQLAKIDPVAIPSSNPNGYTGLARAVALSASYLSAYFGWRNTGLMVASLGPEPSAYDCSLALASLANATSAVYTFGNKFPVESSAWVVSTYGEDLWSAPDFLLNTTYRYMGAYMSPWQERIQAACPKY